MVVRWNKRKIRRIIWGWGIFFYYWRKTMNNKNVKWKESWCKSQKRKANLLKLDNWKKNIIVHKRSLEKKRKRNNKDLLVIRPTLMSLFSQDIMNLKNFKKSKKNTELSRINKQKISLNCKRNSNKWKSSTNKKYKLNVIKHKASYKLQ